MALQQLKSVQFDHYIPFATSASGSVDFGSSDIVTTGGVNASAGGNIGGVSISCGNITATNGDIIASGGIVAAGGNIGGVSISCGEIYASGSIIAAGNISANGFSVSCGGYVSTCGEIYASGSITAGGSITAADNISANGFSVSCGGYVSTRGGISASGSITTNSSVTASTISAASTITAVGSITAYGGFICSGFSVQNGQENVDSISSQYATTDDLTVNSAIDCFSGVVRLSGHQLYMSDGYVRYTE